MEHEDGELTPEQVQAALDRVSDVPDPSPYLAKKLGALLNGDQEMAKFVREKEDGGITIIFPHERF